MTTTTTTRFENQAEANTAFAAAVEAAWGRPTSVSMKVEKCCGTPVFWDLTVAPRAVVGPDLSCEACGMSAHRISTGCPAATPSRTNTR